MSKPVLVGKAAITLVVAAFLALNAFGSGSALAAPLINPGFETGATTGWVGTIPVDPVFPSQVASIDVVGSHIGETATYLAAEGSFFVVLTPDGIGDDFPQGRYTMLDQRVSLVSGETLAGSAAFDTHDTLPFNDNAWVEILDSVGSVIATPWSADVHTVGELTSGPWESWSWTASADGTYTLRYKVANFIDGSHLFASHALFDAAPVPEPSSLILLGSGLAGLVLWRRGQSKRRS
jgi:hypothetical protein